MIVSFTRYLEEHSGGDREQEFFSRCIRYLSVKSGRQVRWESWMITSFDVELGREIGSGGLWVFCLCIGVTCYHLSSHSSQCSARVFEGTWKKMRVAVKVLKSDAGITPNPEVRLECVFSDGLLLTCDCYSSSHARFLYASVVNQIIVILKFEFSQTWSKLSHPHILRKFATYSTTFPRIQLSLKHQNSSEQMYWITSLSLWHR